MFGGLFKLYRLRSNFVNLSDFADAFALKGYCYEISIFSHWQQGRRVPTKRIVLLALLTLFIERKAIRSLSEANQFLESAGHGYLTQTEQEKFRLVVSNDFYQQKF